MKYQYIVKNSFAYKNKMLIKANGAINPEYQLIFFFKKDKKVLTLLKIMLLLKKTISKKPNTINISFT